MEQGVDQVVRQSATVGVEGGSRAYQQPELVIYGTVGDLTFGPNGALTDGAFGGYSFAE